MNKLKIAGFNRGVTAVLSIAAAAADAIRFEPGFRPTRSVFAIAVLDALAEEGRALLIVGPGDAAAVAQPSPRPGDSGGAGAALEVGCKVKIVDYCGVVGPRMNGPSSPTFAIVKKRVADSYAIELPSEFTGGSSLDGVCAEGRGAWVPAECLEVFE